MSIGDATRLGEVHAHSDSTRIRESQTRCNRVRNMQLTQRCFLRRHLRGLSSLFLQDLELHALSSRRQNLEWRNEEDKWKNGQKSQRATATHLKAELNCTLSRPSQTYERTVIKSRLDEIKDHDTQRLQSQGRSKAACTHMQR